MSVFTGPVHGLREGDLFCLRRVTFFHQRKKATKERRQKPRLLEIAEAPPVADKARRFRGSVPIFTPQRDWKSADTTVYILSAPRDRSTGSYILDCQRQRCRKSDNTTFRTRPTEKTTCRPKKEVQKPWFLARFCSLFPRGKSDPPEAGHADSTTQSFPAKGSFHVKNSPIL